MTCKSKFEKKIFLPISWSKHNIKITRIKIKITRIFIWIFFTLIIGKVFTWLGVAPATYVALVWTFLEFNIQYTNIRHIKSVLGSGNRDDMLRFRSDLGKVLVPNNLAFSTSETERMLASHFWFFYFFSTFLLDPDPNPGSGIESGTESRTVMHSGSAKRQELKVPAIPVPTPHHC